MRRPRARVGVRARPTKDHELALDSFEQLAREFTPLTQMLKFFKEVLDACADRN
jgi:hypothetical protein